jgi:hypothetical protein
MEGILFGGIPGAFLYLGNDIPATFILDKGLKIWQYVVGRMTAGYNILCLRGCYYVNHQPVES